MESPKPSQRLYSFLGFLGILLIFWAIFYFVFQGKLRTEHLPGILDPRNPAVYIGLAIFVSIMKEILQRLWERHPEWKEKQDAVIQSHKTIGVMTGIGYFFLFVIGLFVVIPVIALIYFKLTGQI